MLHRHAALYLSLAAIIAQAQDPTSIHAPIQRVRLHPDEAWITRVGSIQLTSAGHHAVQIQGLPQGLNLEDVRISARGPAGTRLGEVSVRHEPQPYRDLPEWKRLRTEWAALEEEAFQWDLLAKGQAQAIQLFEQLSEHQLREAQGRLGMGEIKPQTMTDLVNSIQARSLELQRAKFASALHMEELNQRRARVQEAQDTIKREAEARPVRVLAEVEVLRPGQVEVELTYRTRSASWHPAYEARLSADRTHLELVLLAAVKQSTDQDWSGVAIELANRQASRNLQSPTLPPLPALSFNEGAPPKTSPAPETEVAASQAVVFLKVPGTVDVSHHTEQRFRVTSLDLQPTFRYIAFPRQSELVYLMALVSPPPGFPLMPGSPLNLMQDQERLGTLSLDPPAPGEPLKLSFGAVSGLTATRLRLSQGLKEVGQKAKEREWTLHEQFTISNSLPAAAEVEVMDRQMSSATESVVITEGEDTTEGWSEPQPGQRQWSIQVAPGTHRLIHLHTRIRGPLVGKLLGLGDLTLEGND